jgi:altronate dehydratase large subunit
LDHTRRVLEGVVTHPNIGGVLVVGVGCEQIDAEELASFAIGKPSRFINIQELGNEKSVKLGIAHIKKIMEQMNSTRSEAEVNELIIATQCGSSDTGSGLASNPTVGALSDRIVAEGGSVILGETGSLYGAAGLMARRAANSEIGKKIIEMTDKIEEYSKRMGKSFKEANPTPGNIKSGLTTLVEKSLGGVRKGGTTTIQGVLDPGEIITGKGLWVMNTSKGLGACGSADMFASGAQILIYTTGKGNPVGSYLGPVIKVTATRNTAANLNDIIDFDGSSVLLGDESIDDCADKLFEKTIRVANGEKVMSEIHGHNVFAIGEIIG